MANNCKHTKCGSCGGIKLKPSFIGKTLNEVCSGKCLAAQKDACECKCGGKFHAGNNSKLLEEILNPKKKKVVKKPIKKDKVKKQIFEPISLKDEVALFIQGKRFKTASFDRFSDKNYRRDQKTLALNWLSPKGQSLDQAASDFIRKFNYNADENEIINLIVEIILDYPSGIKQYIKDALYNRDLKEEEEAELIKQSYYSNTDYNDFDLQQRVKLEDEEYFRNYQEPVLIFGTNNMKLKKGSAAAKAFMAKIRAKKNKVGATPVKIKRVPKDASIATYKRDMQLYNTLLRDYNKYSELFDTATISQKDVLNIKLKKIETALSKYERKLGITKRSIYGVSKHKDTKSHNVNIKVVSGTKTVTTIKFNKANLNANFDKYKYKNKYYKLFEQPMDGSMYITTTGKNFIYIEGAEDFVGGWKKGSTRFIEKGEKPFKTKNNIVAKRRITTKPKGSFKSFTSIIAGLFDTKTISDLDGLKQEYRKLANKYHPDKGGSTAQFQELQNEYDKLRNKILSGSSLSESEKENEIVIDDALRAAINAIITLEGINIELIGKWIWVSGNTYPVRTVFSAAGFKFIKKNNIAYWVYKGVESSSRGGTDMQDIVKKYGSTPIKPTGASGKKLSGVKTTVSATQKSKLKTALNKLVKAMNKRPL